MIVRRKTWFYRLVGEQFAQAVTFKVPLTAEKARQALRRTVGHPAELWDRPASMS